MWNSMASVMSFTTAALLFPNGDTTGQVRNVSAPTAAALFDNYEVLQGSPLLQTRLRAAGVSTALCARASRIHEPPPLWFGAV